MMDRARHEMGRYDVIITTHPGGRAEFTAVDMCRELADYRSPRYYRSAGGALAAAKRWIIKQHGGRLP